MAVEVGKRIKGAPNVPFGAKIISGSARAINGTEVAQGIKSLLKRAAHELGCPDEQTLIEMFEAKWRQWPELGKLNVAFPMLQLGVWAWMYDGGVVGVKILMRTDSQRHKEMTLGTWDDEQVVTKEFKVEVGPEARPDDLREKLGLTILIEVELPDGKRQMIEAPTAVPASEPIKMAEPVVVELPVTEPSAARDLKDSELVADLPVVETEAASSQKPSVPRRPKIELGRGAR